MRKVFLSAIMAIGFINLCFAQINTNIERITVRTYDENGLVKKFHLLGDKAHNFNIPSFIEENKEMDRVLIKGIKRNNSATTSIYFDSEDAQIEDGDKICKETKTTATPFLGVWGRGMSNAQGVFIEEIIPNTAAEKAGISAEWDIVAFNGEKITKFHDLKSAVSMSLIGDPVTLEFKNGTEAFSKTVIMGGRESNSISYKYCVEEETKVLEQSNLETATLSAFPNPTSSSSQINFKSNSKEAILFSVRDISGNLIHKETISNSDGVLNLEYHYPNLSAGTYIIVIQQGKEIYQRKVQLIRQ